MIFPVDDDFFIVVGADVESNEFVGEDGNTGCAGVCGAGVAPTCVASVLVGGVLFVYAAPVNGLTKTFTGFCNGGACTGALTNG